jgi:hypothetical protein
MRTKAREPEQKNKIREPQPKYNTAEAKNIAIFRGKETESKRQRTRDGE